MSDVTDEPGTPGRRAFVSLTAWRTRVLRAVTKMRQRPHGQSMDLGLAATVGITTGLLAAALIGVVSVVQTYAFGNDPSSLRIMLAPTLGALLVGLLVTYWLPETRGSGEVQIMRSMATGGGGLRGRTPLAGLAVSGLALGSGVSGGREGPIVLIGGSIGSLLSRVFALDEERKRGLIAAGAAAGIGASFNAPIGGMLYAIELILGGLRARSLQMVVIASVVASVTAQEIIGAGIIYEPTESYELNDPRELLLYLLLGLAAVAAGLGLQYGEYWISVLFERVERVRVWRALGFTAGGLGTGVIALWLPEVLGTGGELPPVTEFREPIQAMLDNEIGFDLDLSFVAVAFLLLLALGKLVATALSVGSGNPVGTFAPLLFIGAGLGGAFGNVAVTVLPEAGINAGAFALVGMAAVFSAAARAPLTAIVIPFELTGDYGLVLPLMLAAGVAALVADRIQPESIHTMPLRHEGIIASEPEEIDLLQTVTVDAVMTTDPLTVTSDTSMHTLRATLRDAGHAVPVVDDDQLTGVVAPADLPAENTDADEYLTAGDLCTRDPVTVAPTAPVYRAMRRMASLDVGMVPVVAQNQPRRLAGVVRRADLVDAYRQAANRSLGTQQRREASQLRDLGGARFLELAVHADAPAAEHAVREITWPHRAVLTGVHRDGELLLPDGDTVLEAGDQLVVLTDKDNTEELRRLITEPREYGAG